MITFKPKKYISKNMIPEALDYLDRKNLRPNLISLEEADEASKVNSRSMVIIKFIRTDTGNYQIQTQDKEGYRYTEKLFKDIFKMTILEKDQDSRKITAETGYIGRALDAIEVLARKYNLSIVTEND